MRAGKGGAGGAARWGPIALLVVVPLIVFWPLYFADFTSWDDLVWVGRNPAFNPPTVQSIGAFWDPRHPFEDLYVPVTFTAWGLVSAVARLDVPDANGVQLNPAIFHVANLLLHVLSGIVVYLLLWRLLRHRWAACAGALLFAVHPVQVEAVAWISGLKDVLAGLLSLLASLGFLAAIDRRESESGSAHSAEPAVGWGAYVGATLAFCLAMLAKPSAMMTPGVAAVLLGFASVWWTRPRLLRRMALLVRWVVLAIPIALIARFSQPASIVAPVALHWRPLIAADSIAFYLGKLFFPRPLGLDYGRSPQFVIQSGQILWTWLVPITVLCLAWALRKRIPALLAGFAVLVLAPLPVLGLTRFDFQFYSTVADHYLYLAMLGPALVTAALLARYWNWIAASMAVAVLLVLGAMTSNQATYWKDNFTLLEHVLAVNPHDYGAHRELGMALAARHEDAAAEEQYRLALEARPGRAEVLYNWANLLLRQGRFVQAISLYRQAEDEWADHAILHNNLGVALMQSARTALPQEQSTRLQAAYEQFDRAAQLDPNYADAQLHLAIMLAMKGDYDAARARYRRALEINPNLPAAQQGLATVERLKQSSRPR